MELFKALNLTEIQCFDKMKGRVFAMIKKSFLALVVIFMISILVTGCGSADKKTIVFWSPLTGDDGAVMSEIVEAYNATDPEFKVEHVITAEMYTKLSTVVNTGSGVPDLTLIHAYAVPGFVDQGILEPVTSLMENQPGLTEANYIPQAWSAGNIDGTQYAVPLDIHGNVMYYNKDLLEKYDCEYFLDDNVVTFEEMLSLQGKLDEGDYVLNDALMVDVAIAQVMNQGGDIQDNGNPTIDTKEMRTALTAIQELDDAGLMTPYGDDGYLMFQAGNVLFSTDGTWTKLAHEAVEGLNFGVTNIYTFSPDKFTNLCGSHLFSMLDKEARTDEKEEGIAAFLEFVRKNTLTWAEAGQIVASREVFESDDYQEFMQSFFTSSEEQTQSLVVADYKYMTFTFEALGTGGINILEIIRSDLDMDQGLAEAQKFIEDRINEQNIGENTESTE